MNDYYGDFAEDETVRMTFNTFDSDGKSCTVTELAAGDIKVHKDGSVDQIATDGATVAINYDGVTGNHLITIDTSAHADYAVGSDYSVRIEGVTIDAVTAINVFIGTFSIENRFMVGTNGANTTAPDNTNIVNIHNIVKSGGSGDSAAILEDTGTTLPARFTGVEGAAFATGTDSLEAIRNHADTIKTKTDGLNFTGTDVKATLDGETVTTDSASRTASKATGFATPTNITAGTIDTVNNGVTLAADQAVDVTKIAGAAVATGTAQIGVNVVSEDNIDFGAAKKTSLNAAATDLTAITSDKDSYKATSVEVSDKTGFSLSVAGILAIWHQLTAAVVTASTMGKLVIDYLNAAVGTRATSEKQDTMETTLGTIPTVMIGTDNAATETKQDATDVVLKRQTDIQEADETLDVATGRLNKYTKGTATLLLTKDLKDPDGEAVDSVEDIIAATENVPIP